MVILSQYRERSRKMLKQEILKEEYEINPYTMMIKPYFKDSKFYSEIIEEDERLIIPEKPLDIVKRSCEYFGSSFDGRKQGTKMLIMVTHKPPIMIDPYTSIYFIPTTSPTNPQCIWISHDHIISHQKGSNNNTIIHFNNDQSFEIPISITSFMNQLSRTARLRIRFQQNIERMEMYPKRSTRSYTDQAAEFNNTYRTKKKK